LIPVHFGSGDRKLFGLYTPAQAPSTINRAVVLCHPWGQEYLRAHRSMRQLASMLSDEGYHTFRFDYFGTGDSFGDFREGDLAGWRSDIESAIEELCDSTGFERVTLLGLRLGGTLAAEVAVKSPQLVESLVLWDPIVSGSEYMAELLEQPTRLEIERGRVQPRKNADGSGWEVRGFPLTEQLADDIETIDLVPLVGELPRKTLILSSQQLPSHALLLAAFKWHNHPGMLEEIEAAPAWLEERNLGAGAIPVKLLHRIVSWLT
jgi:pimeloyl-ACP methyl ester carboxylesterase